jgi:hypothetical protein
LIAFPKGDHANFISFSQQAHRHHTASGDNYRRFMQRYPDLSSVIKYVVQQGLKAYILGACLTPLG